ncbi:hypothetical protein niasHS_008638 [Heterodera schachtii]|uniref:Uncharacterized protein n=1 Tax=Heterodera schachtii TaxID=97005 RepID=A0ABD2J9P0_HETSC
MTVDAETRKLWNSARHFDWPPIAIAPFSSSFIFTFVAQPDIFERVTGDETSSRPINRNSSQFCTRRASWTKLTLANHHRGNPIPHVPIIRPPFKFCWSWATIFLKFVKRRTLAVPSFGWTRKGTSKRKSFVPGQTLRCGSFDDLKFFFIFHARLDYLQFHRFSRRQIAKLVVECRYY